MQYTARCYLKYRNAEPFYVCEELFDKFEKHRGVRNHAQAMRDILCVSLRVHKGNIKLSNARIEEALKKETQKCNRSRQETLRQLVSEQLKEANIIL